MIGRRTSAAIRVLHWTVGLVILLEACRTFSGALARLHDAGHAGALTWVRLGISGPEMVAALLFLIPVTTLVGGYALLIIIGLAIAIHGLHGEFGGMEILVLYGIALYVSMAERRDRVPRRSNLSG
jgi:hypothetical protein